MLWHTCEQSQSSTGMNISQTQLAITKTSSKLGPNHYRNGAWDRLEGQDSINQASKQAKMQRQYNCCVLAAQTATIVVVGHFFACPVPPNDPKCLCVADSDPGSH